MLVKLSMLQELLAIWLFPKMGDPNIDSPIDFILGNPKKVPLILGSLHWVYERARTDC